LDLTKPSRRTQDHDEKFIASYCIKNYSAMSYNIVSVPNGGGAPEQSYSKLKAAGACENKGFAEMFKFEVPSLMVGTLDSLMNLSDELGRTDHIVESVVRKIEKTHSELSLLTKRSDTALTVGGGKIFLTTFLVTYFA